MRVRFFAADKPRERILAEAFIEGVNRSADVGDFEVLNEDTKVSEQVDVACMVGVKSRELFQAHWRAGIHTLYFDKGYIRRRSDSSVHGWEYWRVAIDAHHPTQRLMDAPRDPARFEQFGLDLKPWRDEGEHILISGSSAKYHAFYGLRPPTDYARKLVKQLRGYTDRPIVYRPKPSWRDAEPIDGTRYSDRSESIAAALRGAHALITHGSNACFEAVLEGVPCVVLGDAVAKPISSTSYEEIEDPVLATEARRKQWLANLAWCQWTLKEMASGEAWGVIRPQIFR